MKYNYIFSDMDGTLLDDTGTISPLNLKAIDTFVQMGGYFSVATGRSEIISRPYLSNLKVNFPAILYNGAAIYDFNTNHFLYKRCLSNSVVTNILNIATDIYPNICIEAFVEGPIRLLNPNGTEDHLIVQENQPVIHSSYNDSDEYIKLLLYGEHEKLVEINKHLANLSTNQFISVFSAPFYLEILPEGCSKGTALSCLIDNYSIPNNNIAAIGDYYNDLQMLKVASLSAAPNNAIESVKNQADITVSDNNHSALADLIYSFIL